MPFLETPFDRVDDAYRKQPADLRPAFPWRARGADLCFILVKAAAFLGSTYLMTLGLPLLFFLALSHGSIDMLFAHLANLADRFVGADGARQAIFANELKLGLFGIATMIAIWRLPRFLNDVTDTLREQAK